MDSILKEEEHTSMCPTLVRIIHSSVTIDELMAVGLMSVSSGRSAAGTAENDNNDGKSVIVGGEPCVHSLTLTASSGIDSVWETYRVKSK